MTTKLAGALVAGALAVGIMVGAAGTVLVHDATRPQWPWPTWARCRK